MSFSWEGANKAFADSTTSGMSIRPTNTRSNTGIVNVNPSRHPIVIRYWIPSHGLPEVFDCLVSTVIETVMICQQKLLYPAMRWWSDVPGTHAYPSPSASSPELLFFLFSTETLPSETRVQNSSIGKHWLGIGVGWTVLVNPIRTQHAVIMSSLRDEDCYGLRYNPSMATN